MYTEKLIYWRHFSRHYFFLIIERYVMVFDEFNIHAQKEEELNIVDWDRTYFLTKYYVL